MKIVNIEDNVILDSHIFQSKWFIIGSVIWILAIYACIYISYWFSTIFSLSMAAIFVLLFKAKSPVPRVRQIVIIEYIFMISVTIGVMGFVRGDSVSQELAYYGLIAFFIMQACGFLYNSYAKQDNVAILCSIVSISTIFLWIFSLENARLTIAESNMIYVFGTPAPWWVVGVYVFWFVVVAVGGRSLPNVSEIFVHSFSIFVSIISGSFFFIRLLTASNLLLLDLYLNYTHSDFIGSQHLRLKAEFYDNGWRQFKYFAQRVATALAVIMLISGIVEIGFGV